MLPTLAEGVVDDADAFEDEGGGRAEERGGEKREMGVGGEEGVMSIGEEMGVGRISSISRKKEASRPQLLLSE